MSGETYHAWSVVYGETPSATKWNYLGENDAGLKDGELIDNDAILNRHIADEVRSAIWSVGSIFISAVETNPASLLGFGTWAAFAAGRTLVGIDATQTEFDTLEETGGEKTHTLTVAELAAHTHSIEAHVGDTAGAGYVTDTSYPTISAYPNTGSAGSGSAHNNLQPYIVVYMWKRTA